MHNQLTGELSCQPNKEEAKDANSVKRPVIEVVREQWGHPETQERKFEVQVTGIEHSENGDRQKNLNFSMQACIKISHPAI